MSEAFDEESDEVLLDAWMERGDKRAANRLLMRHIPHLRTYFRNKVTSRADEDDLIQQVLEGFIKAMSSFRKESSFRTFLFQLARHKRRDHFRAMARKRDIVDIDDLSVADLSPGPSTIRSRNRWETLMVEGLRGLALADQELLELRYWSKCTVPELVEILEIEEPAVKSRLRRAKERLRKAMEALAESDEELQRVRTGELDQWAEDVRKQHLGRRRSAGADEGGEQDDDEGDGRDGQGGSEG